MGQDLYPCRQCLSLRKDKYEHQLCVYCLSADQAPFRNRAPVTSEILDVNGAVSVVCCFYSQSTHLGLCPSHGNQSGMWQIFVQNELLWIFSHTHTFSNHVILVHSLFLFINPHVSGQSEKTEEFWRNPDTDPATRAGGRLWTLEVWGIIMWHSIDLCVFSHFKVKMEISKIKYCTSKTMWNFVDSFCRFLKRLNLNNWDTTLFFDTLHHTCGRLHGLKLTKGFIPYITSPEALLRLQSRWQCLKCLSRCEDEADVFYSRPFSPSVFITFTFKHLLIINHCPQCFSLSLSLTQSSLLVSG